MLSENHARGAFDFRRNGICYSNFRAKARTLRRPFPNFSAAAREGENPCPHTGPYRLSPKPKAYFGQPPARLSALGAGRPIFSPIQRAVRIRSSRSYPVE